MTKPLKIDFVSDVSCPWCAIGLGALQQAAGKLADEITLDLHFQPFELNPDMATEGQDVVEHLSEKYGITAEQIRQNGEAIAARGESVGFTFNMDKRGRIYNTFDAHRLLHWAGLQGKQLELKQALFTAYFTEGENPSQHALLVRVAGEVGLDTTEAAEVLATDRYAADVRAQQQYYLRAGIQSVPAVIVNDKHLISGGQPAEVFEKALRQIAAGAV